MLLALLSCASFLLPALHSHSQATGGDQANGLSLLALMWPCADPQLSVCLSRLQPYISSSSGWGSRCGTITAPTT